MIRIDREDYENRVVATLRDELMDTETRLDFLREKRIIVEDLKIDRSSPRHLVQILFREESRLECLFGFAYFADEGGRDSDTSTDTIVIDPAEGYSGPETYASVYVATLFMEQVEAVGYGLPSGCDPNEITWVTDYRTPVTD